MRNKGFMLIETLIASTVIMGALIFLFIQFTSIKKAYENSFKYNTIPGLLNSKVLSNLISENGTNNLDKNLNSSTKGYIILNGNCTLGAWNSTKTKLCTSIIDNIEAEHVLYVSNDITSLQNDLKTNNYDENVFNRSFKNFILTIEPIEANKRNRIIIEYKNKSYVVTAIN